MAVQRKFRIRTNKDFCKGCRLCIEFCPNDVLELSKHGINSKGHPFVEVVEPEKCIGCGNCISVCPDCVIELFEVKS